MQYERACAFLMPKLEKELSAHFTYHNLQHVKEVIQVSQQLAKAEKLSAHQTQILRTAALFHDAGYLRKYDGHEEISCEIAKEYLPQFGYTEKEIGEVNRLIMATRVGHKPADILEAVLCDANFSYLGTDKYFPLAELLFLEMKQVGKLETWEEWQKLQIQFLEMHNYYSPSAIKLFTARKSHNFLLVKSGIYKASSFRSRVILALQDFFLLTFGVLSAAFGLKGFLVPAHFFDGGVTGIALILHTAFNSNLSLTTFVLNLPFIIVSYFVVSRAFAIKAFIGISLLAICLLFVPEQQITSDKLLISVFGGFFIGVGSGLAMLASAVLDGTEVLALYTLRLTNLTIAETILAINVIIFGAAAMVESVEAALYSILTYLVASRMIDYVVEGVEAFTGVTIISSQSEVLKNRLVSEMGRSITVYKGERGYLPGNAGNGVDCDIIFTVVTRLELRKLKNLIFETDPNAFVFANTIKEASGGLLKGNRLKSSGSH